MRKVLFRAKSVLTNGWIEGYGVKEVDDKKARLYTDSGFYEVWKETIGQAINFRYGYVSNEFRDHQFFEGDIIVCCKLTEKVEYLVGWFEYKDETNSFVFVTEKLKKRDMYIPIIYLININYLGNMTDNKELLDDEKYITEQIEKIKI